MEVTVMERTWVAIFSVGFLALCNCGDATSQRIPEQNTPKSASQVQPTLQPIATGKHRISRDSQTIAILQGNQNVKVDYFTELVIGTMIAEKIVPGKLEGDTVSVTRDAKQRDRWIIFRGGASDGDTLTMPENVFRVQKVLISTTQNPVKIQMNGRVYRLQPGEMLLLLG
jgi:hypothetical protein